MLGSLYGQLKRMPRIDRCVKNVLDALYPPRCVLCDRLDRIGLCAECLNGLDRIEHPCFKCGVSCTGPGPCGRCQAQPPAYDITISPFQYQPPLTVLIHRFKYRRNVALARPLANLLSQEITRRKYPRPQLLIPVPLHWTRLLWRGFNQSVELARHISSELDIPISRNLVYRNRKTTSQARLPLRQRQHNISNCFELRRPLNAASVAIVDDVVTSGATVNQMSQELRKKGAVHIQIWALLRAEF